VSWCLKGEAQLRELACVAAMDSLQGSSFVAGQWPSSLAAHSLDLRRCMCAAGLQKCYLFLAGPADPVPARAPCCAAAALLPGPLCSIPRATGGAQPKQ